MPFLLPTSIAMLRLQGARGRDTRGIVFRDRLIPYAAFAERAARAANWLAAAGIGTGDRIALHAANGPALVAWQFAVWEVGAVAVPIGASATAHEVAALVEHARCRLIVCDAPRSGISRRAAAETGVTVVRVDDEARRVPVSQPSLPRSATRSPRPSRPDDLAVLAYTSGTTGRPKGVMLTHANLHWSALSCGAARDDGDSGVALCLSPLTHTPVFVSHLLCRVIAGQTAILLERFSIDTLLDSIARWRVTDLPLIAGMVFPLLEHGGVDAVPATSVRKVSVGGAATPMASKQRLAELFPKAEIIEAYGQSESTDGVVMARGRVTLERPGTIGRPNPYVAVDILTADGSPAGIDEVGEIAIFGPTVMRGYYRDRQASATAIRDGWLHTGDLGRRDGDGYLFITGRAKDIIITGGENVSPSEVEEILRRHPDVADVAVVGTPHPRWGEQVTAAIVPVAGATLDPEALRAFAATRLAPFKKPRRIVILPRLPRNAANKVETARLKELLAKGIQ